MKIQKQCLKIWESNNFVMRSISYAKQFKKDLKKYQHNQKYVDALKQVILKISTNDALERHLFDHALKGEWKDCRECQIKGDFLLIYRMLSTDKLECIRLGSHAELFR